VLDDKNVRRRFRASNYQSTTRVKPFICTMPMRLDDGWNQVGVGVLAKKKQIKFLSAMFLLARSEPWGYLIEIRF
jgi:hypothetical protein